MNESLYAVHTAGFQEDVGTNNIVVGERQTVAIRIVFPSLAPQSTTDMALRCEVQNGINVLRLKNIAHEAGTENIPLDFRVAVCCHFDKMVVRQVANRIEVL